MFVKASKEERLCSAFSQRAAKAHPASGGHGPPYVDATGSIRAMSDGLKNYYLAVMILPLIVSGIFNAGFIFVQFYILHDTGN